tara:strand:- start:33337 stop:33453 length:117 start_codon:yes stop_codon:yes gene_type:complete
LNYKGLSSIGQQVDWWKDKEIKEVKSKAAELSIYKNKN